MQRRKFTSVAMSGLMAASWGSTVRAFDLTELDAATGVREALERGVMAAVNLLGSPDGFLGNPKVHIELPGFLSDAARFLRATGQGRRLDSLETAMNRAAEAAVPEARTLLVSAVKSLTVEDARRLVSGGDNSVTQFFADKTREPLGARFLPIVTRATERVSLVEKYNAVAGRAASLGLLRSQDANIQSYVTEKALEGLFLMIGEEERKIRQDPIGTGSAILRRVFGR